MRLTTGHGTCCGTCTQPNVTNAMTTITGNITQKLSTESLPASSSDSEVEAADGQSNTASSNLESNEVEPVNISTRAQKIKQLNEDFFSSGSRSFKVTTEFIDRLKEYGFLSAGEADKLTANTNLNKTEDGDTKTIAELSKFIDSYVQSIKNVAPESPLLEVFGQAKTILDNLNNPTEASLAIDTHQLIEQLKNYNQTSTEALPKADQQSLNELVLALSLANVLNPGKTTSSEINRYLEVYRF